MVDKEKEKRKQLKRIVCGIKLEENVRNSTDNLAIKYKKPDKYTGHRKEFDNPKRIRDTKTNAFSKGKTVSDKYTEKALVLTKKEAKAKYGKDWSEHLAETDHIFPIEKIYQENQDNPWLTNDDIKLVANDESNMEVVSRQFNNAKRSRNNEELVNDQQYLDKIGLKLSKKGKKRAIESQRKAKKNVDNNVKINQRKNILKEGHAAGKNAALSAVQITGAISICYNIADVAQGKKKWREAVKAVGKDVIISGAMSYSMGAGLTVLTRYLTSSNSPLIRFIGKGNYPAKVVSCVMATGYTLKQFMDGEISSSECMKELGTTGVNVIIREMTMKAGALLIPAPVLGVVIGALVGEAILGGLYRSLTTAMDALSEAKEEYEKVKAVTEELLEEIAKKKAAFEAFVEQYMTERDDAIKVGFRLICEAALTDDTETMYDGLNTICKAFGGEITRRSLDEFDEFMKDDSEILIL